MGEDTQGILTTVYVVKILEKPSLAHLRSKQPVPMAVEMTTEQAKELLKQLQQRVDQGPAGAIRIHMLVDLAHV